MSAVVTDGLDVRNAENPLSLRITQAHVKRATCRSHSECVIAQALSDSALGDVADNIVVGSRCTKVQIGDRIVRYKTPYALGKALKEYDENGNWDLPPGNYELLPYDGATNRWNSAKRNGGKQSTFSGSTRKTPTRKTISIRQMAALKKAA